MGTAAGCRIAAPPELPSVDIANCEASFTAITTYILSTDLRIRSTSINDSPTNSPINTASADKFKTLVLLTKSTPMRRRIVRPGLPCELDEYLL